MRASLAQLCSLVAMDRSTMAHIQRAIKTAAIEGLDFDSEQEISVDWVERSRKLDPAFQASLTDWRDAEAMGYATVLPIADALDKANSAAKAHVLAYFQLRTSILVALAAGLGEFVDVSRHEQQAVQPATIRH